MAKRRAHKRDNRQPASIFAVAFLSSAFTVSMACILLIAFSLGFSSEPNPVSKLLSDIGVLARTEAKQNDNSSLTEVAKLDAQGPVGVKSSLTASVAFKSAQAFVPEPQDIVVDSKDAEPELETVDAAFNEPEFSVAQPANLPEGVPAMLRKSRSGSGIEIGNFRSATIDGDAEECVSLGYSMLSAVSAKEDLLDVMVANKQITIAKICASNGTVVFSCRNGKISISPRRKRPDDSCVRV